MSDTTVIEEGIYNKKKIYNLLIPYLQQKKAHYEKLRQNITIAVNNYMSKHYNPMWEPHEHDKKYIIHRYDYDALTESEKLAIKHIVTEHEVTGFSDLVKALLEKLKSIAFTDDTFSSILDIMLSIDEDTFTQLQEFITTNTQLTEATTPDEGIENTTIGKVYYDIIGKKESSSMSDYDKDAIDAIARRLGFPIKNGKVNYTAEIYTDPRFISRVRELNIEFKNPVVINEGITKRLYTVEKTSLDQLEVGESDANYRKELLNTESIYPKLNKLIKPWKSIKIMKDNADDHKRFSSDEYLSELREDVGLRDIVPHFVRKNTLLLLLQFMDTKCKIIKEITTVIKTLSPFSSLFSFLFKTNSPNQESTTSSPDDTTLPGDIVSSGNIKSHGYIESPPPSPPPGDTKLSLADSPDKPFGSKFKGPAGYFKVGGVHNLHTIPNMYNDYRKRKSRKSRKLRTARKLRKSRKSRKPRKSRKLIK